MKKLVLLTMMFILVAYWGLFRGNPVLWAAEKMMGKEMPAKAREMKGTEGMMKKEGEMMKEEKEMKQEDKMMKEKGKMK